MQQSDEIEQGLWNTSVERSTYADDAYGNHVLEQYKLCLGAADKVSDRRGAANTFFLSFNTAIVGALATFFKDVPSEAAIAFYVAAITMCVAWALLLRSYRTLNTAKFKVIGLMERRLPSSPFWGAEWRALGGGSDWHKHVPLGPIETFAPLIFIAVYVYLAVISF